jgi:uncharacterized RDD family membrane protein YckC
MPRSFSFGRYIAKPGAIEGVGFWPRVAARLIDAVVHNVVAFVGFLSGIVLAIVASSTGVSFPFLLAKLSRSTVLAFFLSLLGYFSYHIICESVHGSTVGKLALSMVVVQEDGSPCRLGSAIIRSFAYLVDGLFFSFIGYVAMQETPQMQRNGDKWAHTIVCKRFRVQLQHSRSTGRFVLGLFLAVLADATLISISVALKFL